LRNSDSNCCCWSLVISPPIPGGGWASFSCDLVFNPSCVSTFAGWYMLLIPINDPIAFPHTSRIILQQSGGLKELQKKGLKITHYEEHKG
jgi:hypothetical protein